MNNKDLFNAINNIDEEYINDAGKYLNPNFDDGTVEFRPEARKKLSPVKIAAPIAAAVAVVCGVAFVAGTQRPTEYSPASEGIEATESDDGASTDTENGDTSSDISNVDETSTPTDTESTAVMDEHLKPYFENHILIGPDGKQLIEDENRGWFLNDPPTNIVKYYVEGLQFGFAYIAEPSGANYNSADNPEAFEDGFVFNGSTDFKRVYDDDFGRRDKDKIGSFGVSGAWNEYVWADEDSDELVYNKSYLELSGGALLEDVYLVKSGDEYYCIARNGAKHLPSTNIKQQGDGSYSLVPYSGNISGLEYITETPPILLDIHDNQKDVLDKLLGENGYIKARVHIFNTIRYFGTDDIEVYSSNVISVQSGNYEPKEVAAFINSETSSAKLKADLVEKFGFTDVQVCFNFSDFGIDVTQDMPVDPERAPLWGEDELIEGMAVKVYDENGLCGIYTYGDFK